MKKWQWKFPWKENNIFPVFVCTILYTHTHKLLDLWRCVCNMNIKIDRNLTLVSGTYTYVCTYLCIYICIYIYIYICTNLVWVSVPFIFKHLLLNAICTYAHTRMYVNIHMHSNICQSVYFCLALFFFANNWHTDMPMASKSIAITCNGYCILIKLQQQQK